MQRLISASLAVTLLAGSAAIPAHATGLATRQDAAATVDQALSASERAERFMDGVLARYRDAKTYSHDAEQRMEIEFQKNDPMMPEMPSTLTRFRYEAPGSFALTGGDLLDVYAAGGSLTTHAPLVGKYAVSETSKEKPTLKDLPGMFRMIMPQQYPFESIVLEKPGTFAQTPLMVAWWGSLEERPRDGRPGHRVACTIGGMMGMPKLQGTVWVDGETGLVGAYELDITAMMTQMEQPGMPAPKSARQIYEFKKVSINAPIGDDAFTFEPGEDDTRVDTFPSMDAIMQEAFGGMPGEGGGMGGDAGPELGTAAPAFSAKTIDGEPMNLEDLKGRVVLIDFWATWCGPCVQAMPTIQALHEKYADRGLVVIGVSLDSPKSGDAIKEFLEDKKITFAQIHDADGSIAEKFGVSPIPHSVIIGKDGTVQANHIGFMPGMDTQYTEEIEALLEGDSLVDG